jgi:hypothetical protein
MTALSYANLWSSALTGAIDDAALSCTVVSTAGSPAVPFRARIRAEGAHTDEIVTVTAKSGSLTIERAAEAIGDGTQVADAHASGATLEAVLTAGLIDQLAAGGGGSSDLDALLALSGGQDIADALTGAATPSAANVLATIDDLPAGSAALVVQEVDGTPTDSAVTKIIFPNGTLSITSHEVTFTPAGGSGAVATDTIWDAAGDLAVGTGADTAAKLTMGSALQQLRVNAAGTALEYAAPSGGSGVTTVDQDISADFTSAADSAWHDITGLTGIVLAAGTWIGTIDLEILCGAAFGPVFRIYDGTTTYAQMGWIAPSPPGAISGHHFFTMKPTVLGSSTTVSIQVYTDTSLSVNKYPTRGGITTSVASHVTFMKIA